MMKNCESVNNKNFSYIFKNKIDRRYISFFKN